MPRDNSSQIPLETRPQRAAAKGRMTTKAMPTRSARWSRDEQAVIDEVIRKLRAAKGTGAAR